jgi:hypothetical protein
MKRNSAEFTKVTREKFIEQINKYDGQELTTHTHHIVEPPQIDYMIKSGKIIAVTVEDWMDGRRYYIPKEDVAV